VSTHLKLPSCSCAALPRLITVPAAALCCQLSPSLLLALAITSHGSHHTARRSHQPWRAAAFCNRHKTDKHDVCCLRVSVYAPAPLGVCKGVPAANIKKQAAAHVPPALGSDPVTIPGSASPGPRMLAPQQVQLAWPGNLLPPVYDPATAYQPAERCCSVLPQTCL
jgi:hypothetical protein